jgi:hypothetical protein
MQASSAPLENQIQVPLGPSANVHPSAQMPFEISAVVEPPPQSIVEVSTDGEQQKHKMILEICTDTSKHFDVPPGESTRPPEPLTATSKQNDDIPLVETTLPKEPDALPVVRATNSLEPSTDTSKHFGGVPIIVENVREAHSVSQGSERRLNVLKIRVRQSSSKADDGNNRNQHCMLGWGNENEAGPCSSVSVDAPVRSTREISKVNIDEEANSFHNHDSRMTTSIASANKRVSLHDGTLKDLKCTADSKIEDGGSSHDKISSEEKEAKVKRKKDQEKQKDKKKIKREDKPDQKDDPVYLEKKRLKKEKRRLEKEREKMESKGVLPATSDPRIVFRPVVAPVSGPSVTVVPPVSRGTNKVQQQSVAPKIRIKIKGFGLGSSTPSEK